MTTPRFPTTLRELTIFADCSTAELRNVAPLLTCLRFPAGHVLMREREPGREAMFIVDGIARVTREGRETATLGRGEVVGEMALLGDGLRSATVTALTPLTVYVCTQSEFTAVRGVAPLVDRAIAGVVTDRVQTNRASRPHRRGFRRQRRQPAITGGAWRSVELPGRGTTNALDLAGPSPQSETVVLLHGLMMTGALNWEPSLPVLNERYRVVALDQRGHGRGIATDGEFSLEDCADDAVALIDALGIDRAMFVGYSMGGPIAQLVWRRHPERVTGLVLCATAADFRGGATERLVLSTMPEMEYALGVLPTRLWALGMRSFLAGVPGNANLKAAVVGALSHDDHAAIRRAGRAVREFNSTDWIGEVSVPTVVTLTRRDRLVPPALQLDLVRLIVGAEVVPLDAGHMACCTEPDHFSAALREACDRVARRRPARRRPRRVVRSAGLLPRAGRRPVSG